jgi:hypothetical protein
MGMAYRDQERERLIDGEKRKRDKTGQTRKDKTRTASLSARLQRLVDRAREPFDWTGLGLSLGQRERKAQFTLPCLPCLFKVQGGRIEDQE